MKTIIQMDLGFYSRHSQCVSHGCSSTFGSSISASTSYRMLFCFFVNVVTESCKTKQCHFCILVVPDRLQKPKLNATVLQAESVTGKLASTQAHPDRGTGSAVSENTYSVHPCAERFYKLVINHLTPTVPHKDNSLGSLRMGNDPNPHTLFFWSLGQQGKKWSWWREMRPVNSGMQQSPHSHFLLTT